MELKQIFDAWAKSAGKDYAQKQWLLSKWELFEGIDWPPEKNKIMINSIVAGLKLDQSKNLVDLGCGGGWILQNLKNHAGKIYGLDFSTEMLKLASSACPDETFIGGEIGQLPFKPKVFDRALAYYVFLNFTDDRYVERSLLEIFRVLKSGGRALIGQLPDTERSRDYDGAKDQHIKYCRERFKIGRNIRDIHAPPLRLFDRKQLKEFLNKQKIDFQFQDSFNPFYRSGQPELIGWRFDLILKKD